MKPIKNIFTLLFISTAIGSTSVSLAEGNQKYTVESAKIFYEIKGSGNIMNTVKFKTIGKKRLIFNQFGANELTEVSEIKKTLQGGKTTTDKTHKFQLMKGSTSYNVNFKKKEITRRTIAGGMGALFGGARQGKSPEEMMKSMGGKKLGTDTVIGFECTVWDLMGSKQCIYKGIPLRIETDVMSMKNVEVATKAEFNISVSKDDLKLPDYPVYQFDMDLMMQGKKPVALDKSKLEKMDARDAIKAGKEAEQAQEMLNLMAQAAEQAGMKKGEKSSEVQQEAMIANMKNAAFPMMKRRMLESVGLMEFAADCLASANTLKAANKCGEKAAKKFPESDYEDMNFDAWNPQIKQEVMTDLKESLKAVGCMKKSNSMSDFEKCAPGMMD